MTSPADPLFQEALDWMTAALGNDKLRQAMVRIGAPASVVRDLERRDNEALVRAMHAAGDVRTAICARLIGRGMGRSTAYGFITSVMSRIEPHGRTCEPEDRLSAAGEPMSATRQPQAGASMTAAVKSRRVG